VAGVAFAITFLTFKIPSNPPLSLPAAVPIYGRDEFVQEVIDKILLQKSDSGVKKHIALRGGPGMGKTTTGIRIMHHPRIARHFGKARHWVSCREASSIADDLKAQKLIEYISDSLDLDLSGSVDRRKDIRYFLNRNNVPRIIVLDNFETMWEPPDAQEAVEAVLAFLASFPQLTILLTTRNAHHPATQYGVSWHQIKPIQPLSLDASRILFTSLSFSHTIDNRLDDLLCEVDRIPLLIVLMASYGQENYTTSQILEIWNTRLSQRIETHKHDGDPMNKLDLSIAMSLEGPLIESTPEAPVLLRIMAGLPGGIRHENLRAIVPFIQDVDGVVAVLSRTSLVINSPDVWQIHSTIRSHMLRRYSLDASHRENIRAFYFQLIHDAGHDPGGRDFLQRARRLSYEETNAQAILLDALEHNLSVTSVSISTDYSNYLIWNTPSIDIPKRTVELIRKQPSLTRDSLLPLPLLRLGVLYFRLGNYPKAIEALKEAMDRYETLGQLNGAAQAQLELAEIHNLQHEHTPAVQLYFSAYERFKDTEDSRGMAACLRGIGIAYFQDDRYSDAVEMIVKAQNTCLPDDHTCIADSERELGRVYRDRNTTESKRLLTKAREYYKIHGPRGDAAIALYQKSIALYLRGDYGEAEVGLNEAYEEFKPIWQSCGRWLCPSSGCVDPKQLRFFGFPVKYFQYS
jgi:tetratricopeptide (TPR) repeat protein